MEQQEQKQRKIKDPVAYVVYLIYLLAVVVSMLLLVKVVYIQTIWKPDPSIARRLSQPGQWTDIPQQRGNIYSHDGRVLAMSFPRYQVVVEPNIRKKEFAKIKSADRRKKKYGAWDSALQEFLSQMQQQTEGKVNAESSYQRIMKLRASDTCNYMRLGSPVEYNVWKELKKTAIIKNGANWGGVYVEEIPTRRYPYGDLAYRTIGFIRDPRPDVTNNKVGLDGSFDQELSGSKGRYYRKLTDNGYARDFDSLYVAAVDGANVHTTLNMDYQELAHATLLSKIKDDQGIEAGCCIIMDVASGAIRTMVNLGRGKDGQFHENQNYAIGRLGEPGSVFKTVTLMTMLEDGHLRSLDDCIPTNGGKIPGYLFEEDKHISRDWEKAKHRYTVPILYGMEKSSNYVFRYLAIMNYGKNPKEFVEKLYQYKLGDKYEFDIAGLKEPRISGPSDPLWNKHNLGQMAMGYNVAVTPLHLITYYNAIAGKGRMMKPYLVEKIEKDGVTLQQKGPSVLNAAICSKATADTLNRALEAVTSLEGTGRRLNKAKCTVAGKTGTAYVYLEDAHAYRTSDGKRKCQGTFVGYFPSENPQYSIICTIYSGLSEKDYNGGTIPAQVVREIVDRIYDIDPYWNETL